MLNFSVPSVFTHLLHKKYLTAYAILPLQAEGQGKKISEGKENQFTDVHILKYCSEHSREKSIYTFRH